MRVSVSSARILTSSVSTCSDTLSISAAASTLRISEVPSKGRGASTSAGRMSVSGAAEGGMCIARLGKEALNLLASEIVVCVPHPARSAQLLDRVDERLQPGLLVASEGTYLRL